MTTWLLVGTVVLGAVALWLLLPRGRKAGRRIGAVLGAVALGMLLGSLPPLGGWFAQGLFWLLAAVTLGSAACAVSFRNPVYCAVWFGLTLFGTAGLLFFQGAQFLGAATIIIYAGAILVTLLFVLMLANPRGQAAYDRRAWEAPLAATVGVVLLGLFSTGFFSTLKAMPEETPAQAAAEKRQPPGKYPVSALGAELFSRHLVAVEVAGTLLLAALAGAVAVVAQHAQREQQEPRPAAPGQPTRPQRELTVR